MLRVSNVKLIIVEQLWMCSFHMNRQSFPPFEGCFAKFTFHHLGSLHIVEADVTRMLKLGGESCIAVKALEHARTLGWGFFFKRYFCSKWAAVAGGPYTLLSITFLLHWLSDCFIGFQPRWIFIEFIDLAPFTCCLILNPS